MGKKKNEVRLGFTETELKILQWVLVNISNGSMGSKPDVVSRRPEFATLRQKVAAAKAEFAKRKENEAS